MPDDIFQRTGKKIGRAMAERRISDQDKKAIDEARKVTEQKRKAAARKTAEQRRKQGARDLDKAVEKMGGMAGKAGRAIRDDRKRDDELHRKIAEVNRKSMDVERFK